MSDATMERIREKAEATGRLLEEPNAKFRPVGERLLTNLRDRQGGPVHALPTFLDSWNRASRGEGGGQGLAPGWFVVVAGHTGAGKTLIALNQVARALREGVNVLYITLEMSWMQLCTRLRPIVTGEEVTRMEWGEYFDGETTEKADREILDLPGTLYLNTSPIWRLKDIRQVIRDHREGANVGLVVVDYAQLIDPSGRNDRLFEAMTAVSNQLRHAAQKHRIAALTISQMNRRSTTDRASKPTVDGLFGASRFGQDADQVLILDWTRREDDLTARWERTWLVFAKNRHGPQVDIPVELDKSTLRYREARPDEEESWPGAGR